MTGVLHFAHNVCAQRSLVCINTTFDILKAPGPEKEEMGEQHFQSMSELALLCCYDEVLGARWHNVAIALMA